MTPEIVRIVWVDSGEFSTLGWNSKEAYLDQFARSRAKVETTGYIAHEDDDWIYIGLSYDSGNSHFFGLQAIFKQNISHRKVLVKEQP